MLGTPPALSLAPSRWGGLQGPRGEGGQGCSWALGLDGASREALERTASAGEVTVTSGFQVTRRTSGCTSTPPTQAAPSSALSSGTFSTAWRWVRASVRSLWGGGDCFF